MGGAGPVSRSSLCFERFDPQEERARESLFALGNGTLAIRGASADARTAANQYPGLYRAGCYARIRSDIAGTIDATESLARLPNPLFLTFRIAGGRWFALGEARLLSYRYRLDCAQGVTERSFRVCDERGRVSRVRECRLASLHEPQVVAMRYELTAENWSGEVEFCSAIIDDVVNRNVARYQWHNSQHLEALKTQHISAEKLLLTCRTRGLHTEVALATRTCLVSDQPATYLANSDHGAPASSITAAVHQGATLALEKHVVVATSLDKTNQAPSVVARRKLARAAPFDRLRAQQTRAWAELWQHVEFTATSPSAATVLRFHMFHVLQTVAPGTRRLDVGIPARGWSGEAYRGHVFWDDIFVLPFLLLHFPDTCKAVLNYRYRRLGAARKAATEAGHKGAMYPWRSAATGAEVTPCHQKNLLSGHWLDDPTRRQRHIGTAIIWNIWHYYLATGDTSYLRTRGIEMMVEIVRFYASLASYDKATGRYDLKGVIGPDEYHNSYPGAQEAGLNTNAYTNLMVAWALRTTGDALALLTREQQRALQQKIGLKSAELTHWQELRCKLKVAFDQGIINQFAGFTELEPFDRERLPERYAGERIDWALEAEGRSTDEFQVIKQADTMTLLYLLPCDDLQALLAELGYTVSRSNLLNSAQYYLARTTHRSSLSQIVYAGALVDLDPAHAWALYCDALSTDLHKLRGESTAEGIHLGAMGGTLDVLQRHFVGLQLTREGLQVNPRMPAELGRVTMKLRYHGQTLFVDGDSRGVWLQAAAGNTKPIRCVIQAQATALAPGEKRFVAKAHQSARPCACAEPAKRANSQRTL